MRGARVGRAHRIRLLRGVQNMLDVGSHGVIDVGHIGFVGRGRVVTGVFREDDWSGAALITVPGTSNGLAGASAAGSYPPLEPGYTLSLLANLKLSGGFGSTGGSVG